MRPALLIAAAALTAALAGGGPALAQPAAAPDPTITDVRCILVAGSLSQQTDPDLQKLGQISLVYFLGRIEGRGAQANLASMIADQASKMSADDIKAQAQICGAIFTAASQSLQDIGSALQQKEGASPAK